MGMSLAVAIIKKAHAGISREPQTLSYGVRMQTRPLAVQHGTASFENWVVANLDGIQCWSLLSYLTLCLQP